MIELVFEYTYPGTLVAAIKKDETPGDKFANIASTAVFLVFLLGIAAVGLLGLAMAAFSVYGYVAGNHGSLLGLAGAIFFVILATMLFILLRRFILPADVRSVAFGESGITFYSKLPLFQRSFSIGDIERIKVLTPESLGKNVGDVAIAEKITGVDLFYTYTQTASIHGRQYPPIETKIRIFLPESQVNLLEKICSNGDMPNIVEYQSSK